MNGKSGSDHGRERLEPTKEYDVVVAGATPGGIACALRCAREGLRVMLTEASNQIGGMWTSGVQVLDTRYDGHRCPMLAEFLARLECHYRQASGEGSPDHAMAQYGEASRHGQRPRFEPRVAEAVFREMLADSGGVCLQLRCTPISVVKDDARIEAVTFMVAEPDARFRVRAQVFVDATYAADLAALAGAPCRTGREGRAEFNEPHAGVHFTTIEPIGPTGHDLVRDLSLHFFDRTSRASFAGSTGEADRAVQAYAVRLVLTDRAENRQDLARPVSYDRTRYLGALDRSPGAHTRRYPLSSHLLVGSIERIRMSVNMPNGKMDWFGGNLVGGNHAYPLANVVDRQQIYQAHVDHALGLLYFLQHDSAVPAGVRAHMRPWGLARDEYVANGNIPPRMYVREARRLDGLHVFSEHDALRHPAHRRTPIHPDSVAFAEWPMDSHDCNPVRQPGSFNDGEFILAEQTLPSQVPYRCLLTEAVDNLLVSVCLSSTHVGWGTLRLEPVFMHVGEAAAVAASLCVRAGKKLRDLNAGTLQWELLQRRIAVAYFADVDLGGSDPAAMSAQYLCSRGFFSDYHANLTQRLSPEVVGTWQSGFSRWVGGRAEPDQVARDVFGASRKTNAVGMTDPLTPNAAALLRRHGWNGRAPETIGEAALLLCYALREADTADLAV